MTLLKLTAEDFDNGKYRGSLDEFDVSVEIAGGLGTVFFDSLAVAGSIVAGPGTGIKAGAGIQAGAGIKAGLGIEAGHGIEAGEGIRAGRGIEAGWSIRAGHGIEADDGIEAGHGIEAGWSIVCKGVLKCRGLRLAVHDSGGGSYSVSESRADTKGEDR